MSLEALENLPEDVSRDKTRSKIAFQKREEIFRPKAILEWGLRSYSAGFWLAWGALDEQAETPLPRAHYIVGPSSKVRLQQCRCRVVQFYNGRHRVGRRRNVGVRGVCGMATA